jgi:hypothetical protein
MEKPEGSNQALFPLICRAVALALGVAVIVLNFLHTLTPDTQAALLGIGLISLAIASFAQPTQSAPRAGEIK